MKPQKQNEACVCLAGHHVYMNNTPIVISVRGLISSMDALLFCIEKQKIYKVVCKFPQSRRLILLVSCFD